MIDQAIQTGLRTPAAAAAVTPEVLRRELAAGASFKAVLEQTTAATQDASVVPEPAAVPSRQTVVAGDTLSHMVLRHMRAQGLRPAVRELYARVDQVARENGLADADRIVPGQVIVFGPAAPGEVVAMAETAPPDLAVESLAARPAVAALAERRPSEGVRDASRPAAWHRILDGVARLSSPFGLRNHPITGQRHFHAGIDVAAPSGTRVRPLRPGVVTFSGTQGGYGNTVIVRHADGIETLYAHLENNLVKAGDHVRLDTALGLVGSTGRSTGPHLHFEVRRNGHVFDPMPFLR